MHFPVVRNDIDELIAPLAARQFGVFSRTQAKALGAGDDLIKRRRAGRWTHEGHGVYGLPGARDTYLRRLWISHLAIGMHSVVSHESAAALHDLTGFPRTARVFTVPHSGYHRIEATTVHQISDLTRDSCVEIAGLAVTNVARTLTDLVAVTRVGRLAAALDDAVITQRRTSYGAVAREVAGIARRGKPHLGLLVALLDARGPGTVPPQSELERCLFRLLADFGLPEPRRQFAFPGQVFTHGCVDAAYPAAKLILEADGRRWHTRIQDLARDHHRDAEASRAGWATLRLLYETITDEPDWTATLVADTLATRLAQLGVNSTH